MKAAIVFGKWSNEGAVLNPAVCGPRLLGLVTYEGGSGELVVFDDFTEASKCVADAVSGMTVMTSCVLFAKVPT
jgi:hypothetical protein